MFENLKKFTEDIQNAGSQTKKRWLFVFSALTMILVVGLWVIYLNETIASLAPTNPVAQAPIESIKESPWQIFKTGLQTVTGQFKDMVTATRKISIEYNTSKNITPASATSSSLGVNSATSSETNSAPLP